MHGGQQLSAICEYTYQRSPDGMKSCLAKIFVRFAPTRYSEPKAMLTSSQLLYSLPDICISTVGLAEAILLMLLDINIYWNLRRTFLQECRTEIYLCIP
jgi:hypothetical protein